MKKLYSLFVACFIVHIAYGQCLPNRYKTAPFTQTYRHENVKYGEAPEWNVPFNIQELYMDIYEPLGDTLRKRPCMIWVHPGAFLTGDKQADDMVALCDTFARRGYVTASIGYRLGFNPFDSESAERAVYRGTQDARSAFRFLKEFAEIYDIDTSRMFIGGSSAGGFAALHLAYLQEEERPLSTYAGSVTPDLECLDCTGNTYQHDVDPLGIINMWGALGDSTYRNAIDTIPVLLMHGTEDDVVPFNIGSPFDVPFLPITHGSLPIKNQSDALGLPYVFVPFYGEGHEPHGVSNGYFDGNPPTPYWDTIIDNTSNFYFDLFKPADPIIQGLDFVCTEDSLQIYTTDALPSGAYCWDIVGGDILDFNDYEILIDWEESGSITLTVYNEVRAASQAVTMEVEVGISPEAGIQFVQNDLDLIFIDNSINAAAWMWDLGDGTLSSTQNVFHTYDEPGIYTVTLTVTSVDGCTSQVSQEIEVILTDVEQIENKSLSLNIYPNPVGNKLMLETGIDQGEILCWSIDGRLMWQELLSANLTQVSTENLPSGIYLIQLKNEQGSVFEKLVKR